MAEKNKHRGGKFLLGAVLGAVAGVFAGKCVSVGIKKCNPCGENDELDCECEGCKCTCECECTQEADEIEEEVPATKPKSRKTAKKRESDKK